MDSLLIKNGTVIDVINGTSDVRDIKIDGDKITAIAKNITADNQNTKIIDASNKYVFPGLIDVHTHLGIIEEATGKIGIDNNETSNPVTPELRAIDAVNPFDIAFRDALRSGITTVMCTPGSDNVVGGQNAAIKTAGTIIDKMIVRNPLGLKIALGENPISTYGKNKQCPVTRMGIVGLIRGLFMRAQDYMSKKENGGVKERDIQLEAVIPVLKGDTYLRAHAHRADDIVSAIRIAEEFNIRKLVIEHGTEAHLVKDYLSEKKIPVAFGPMLTPRIKMELKRRQYSSVRDLVNAGIKVGLITDHPYNSIDQLRTVAILAVAEGLNADEAARCITINSAEILGLNDKLGSVDVGKEADIVIFNGHPLDINSDVDMTIISGKTLYKRDK